MEFRHLKYFVTVAEELHFSRAAEKLYLTQPALSKQIRALEAELQVKLFDRAKQRIKLTRAGETFLETARRILTEVERGTENTKKAAREELGQLSIAFTAAALHTILPPIMTQFQQIYPDVELILTELCTEDQVEALQSDRIDLGFLHPPIRDRDRSLNLHLLQEDSILLAIPASHPLAEQEKIAIASLANQPLILYPRQKGPVIYEQFLRSCQLAGFVPNVVQEVEAAQTRLGLVAAGIGISFILSSTQNLSAKGVVYRSLDEELPKLQLSLAWQKDNLSPVLQKFLQVATHQPAKF